jgi:hypothetical protein
MENIKNLDLKERITLWKELWTSIIKGVELPVSVVEKKHLDHRYKKFQNNPEYGRPWKEIYDDLETYQ